MPRVLLVDLERSWRGGQSQALLLLQGLRSRGHAAELLSVQGSALASRASAENIPVHEASARTRRLAAALLLGRLLRPKAFDIVHANEAHALTAAWLAGAHRRTALVAARRVALPLGSNVVSRARYRAARRIIAISRFVADEVKKSLLGPSAVEIVYDGVAVPPCVSLESRRRSRERWGIAEAEPLIGCVGCLLPEKGQEFLVRALPQIRASFPSCRLLLAGDGAARHALERLAEMLGVRMAIHFAGHVGDVSEVYRALDIFVFPSLAEPLGSSLLEAMSWKLPVIAIASGAVPEVVEDQRSGLLLPRPDPEAIGEAVVRLISNPELAVRLGCAARQAVEQRFTADQMVEGTLRIYDQVCGLVPGE